MPHLSVMYASLQRKLAYITEGECKTSSLYTRDLGTRPFTLFAFFSIIIVTLYRIFIEVSMLEELKMPISQLREDIMNVWGRL